MAHQKIVVLGTGGTIAGTAASATDSRNYRAAQKGVGELLAGLPAPAGHALLHDMRGIIGRGVIHHDDLIIA